MMGTDCNKSKCLGRAYGFIKILTALYLALNDL
jgi:hypothetical protein